MTIQGAIALADELKPNLMTRAAKLAFLNEIEGMIHAELLMKHVHTQAEEQRPVYDDDTDPSTELLIPSPYEMLYPYWIISKIDHQNQEMDKYNNDRALFENAYQQAADWMNRERQPIRRVREIRI